MYTRTVEDSNEYPIRLDDGPCGAGCPEAAAYVAELAGREIADPAKLVDVAKRYMIDYGHEPNAWTFTVRRNQVTGETSVKVEHA